MLVTHQNSNAVDQQRRITVRCEIEKFCEAVESLNPEKRIIFRLFFRDGESMTNIAKACGVHKATISRRLKRTTREIEKIVYGRNGGG